MVLNLFSKNILYPLFQIKEKQYGILKKKREICKVYNYNKNVIDKIRIQKLRKLFVHSYNNCSYYNELFDKCKVNINKITFESLKNIPVLSKDIININRETLIATNLKSSIEKDTTGGSTAKPMVFYRDRNCWDLRNAYQLYLNQILGWDVGERYALIWGASRDLSINKSLKAKIKEKLIFRRIILNAIYMAPSVIDKFIDEFLKFKPAVVYGYPSAINEFCRSLTNKNINNLNFVKTVICTAEPLNSDQRKNISNVFGCNVYNRYTSRECGILAQECAHNIGMHVNYLSVDLQIRNKKILITDLDNWGMPLINYDIGDMTNNIELAENKCKCGFPGPMITLDASRETDFFIKRDGTMIFGAGIPIISLTGESGIQNIQIIQKTYELFVVKIVKDSSFNETNISRIQAELEKYLGDDVTINFEFVDEIL